jgi:RES domain-containing protein
MAEAWRIVKENHAASAFSGEGAGKSGGRWNSRGVPVVYTSSTMSLAALETLVHLNPPVVFKYVVIRIKFDDALVEILTPKALPPDWRVEPPPQSSQAVGDSWVREARSAVLALPSVIISQELNYLLNPAHPDFKRISIGKPRSFTFDPRLLAWGT